MGAEGGASQWRNRLGAVEVSAAGCFFERVDVRTFRQRTDCESIGPAVLSRRRSTRGLLPNGGKGAVWGVSQSSTIHTPFSWRRGAVRCADYSRLGNLMTS